MVAAVAPPPPKPAAPSRIKQGGNVTAASIITQTRPLYPPLARQARIQGNVVLHAIIDKDGKVAQLEVISGHPLLVQSALDAVKQWRYKPTLLNGDPVEVDTTITVTFTMGGEGLCRTAARGPVFMNGRPRIDAANQGVGRDRQCRFRPASFNRNKKERIICLGI
jgi:TonB family protein